VLASLGYHDYEGVALRDDEQPRLQKDLGERKFLMLRNHGLLAVGRTIPDAFLSMYFFENACRIQIDAQAGGELVMIDPRIIEGMEEVMRKGSAGQGPNIAWPALLRRLDKTDPSYKT
jgi:ribulose-5-phosphate 4-epimerase/fuculose-1-phosphate aldolase